jgi:hypothetical protein
LMPSADSWPGFQGHARRIREKDERPERPRLRCSLDALAEA